MYTAHGIGYLTPIMFSFSPMSDRHRLASLPGATLITNAVNFPHADGAQPSLDAAKLLMEAADTPGGTSNISSPPDSDFSRQ